MVENPTESHARADIDCTRDHRLASDGGKPPGKEAPPEDMLAAPARKLGTEPHPRKITAEIDTILDAVSTIAAEVDSPHIDSGLKESEQLKALATALEEGKITIGSGDSSRSPHAAGQLSNAVDTVRNRQPGESEAARRLLDDLGAIRTRDTETIATTLENTVEMLDNHEMVRTSLSSVSMSQDQGQLGQQLSQEFEGKTSPNGRQLEQLGQTLESTAADLKRCRAERSKLSGAARTVCQHASNQTSITVGAQNPTEGLSRLEQELQQDSIWFADHTTGISEAVSTLESRDKAQSKPAREFLDTLKNIDSVGGRQLEETLTEAVEAIDRTETLAPRLQGVDSDSLVRNADRLLSDLQAHDHDAVQPLRERLTDLKETAERANESDLLTLYATRQELHYYDRTLFPKLRSTEDTDAQTHQIQERIEELDTSRADMRHSYPAEYPDCDHTIPIYLFDLTSTLLEEARDAQKRGDQQRAVGLADAAEQTLEWIEGLYETHSYFVLLKELRG